MKTGIARPCNFAYAAFRTACGSDDGVELSLCARLALARTGLVRIGSGSARDAVGDAVVLVHLQFS